LGKICQKIFVACSFGCLGALWLLYTTGVLLTQANCENRANQGGQLRRLTTSPPAQSWKPLSGCSLTSRTPPENIFLAAFINIQKYLPLIGVSHKSFSINDLGLDKFGKTAKLFWGLPEREPQKRKNKFL
jgi:hypothetical protein